MPAEVSRSGCSTFFRRFWRYGIVWPFRLMCVMFVLGIIGGFVTLWRVPGLAARYNVDTFDLLLRILDKHEADPLYVLRGRKDWHSVWVTFPSGETSRHHTAADGFTPVRKGPHRYELRLTYRRTESVTVEATTPHTRIPPEEMARARAVLRQLYSWEDEKKDTGPVAAHLHRFGTGLFRTWWDDGSSSAQDTVHFPSAVPEPTADEQLWFAWRQLRADMPTADRDLPRLAELARETFPKEADYQAAMKWAETFYDRLQENYRNRKKETKQDDVAEEPAVDVLPPRNETTLHWLLYQFVGLNDDSRRQVHERWLDYFPASKADKALAWGRELEERRRADGEPLPPTSDNVALLCVIERFTGTDAYGTRTREAREAGFKGTSWGILEMVIQTCFPSDDFFYLLASGDALGLHSWDRGSNEPGAVPAVLACFLFLLMIWYGQRLLLFGVLGDRLLKLRDNDHYVRFRDRRKGKSWMDLLFTLGLIPAFTWVLAVVTLPRQLSVLVTPLQLVLGVYLSLFLGGTVMVMLTRLVAVLLLWRGVNVEAGWWDEVIGLTAGAYILWHFGNDPLSMVSFVAFALVPEILLRNREAAAVAGR